MINLYDLLKKWIIKRGNWSTKRTAVRKQKVITLEVKLNVVRFGNGDSKAKTR